MTPTTIDTIKKIEQALGITIEEHSYGRKQEHTYRLVGKGRIYSLKLKNITFKNFDALSLVYKDLIVLELIDCIIHDISALFNFERLSDISLDGVTLNNSKIVDQQCTNASQFLFHIVRLQNMKIEHVSFFLPMFKNTHYLHLTQCDISNFYEVNLLPKLYHLIVTDVIFHQTKTDVLHKADPKRKFIFLDVKNMQVHSFEFFLPISEKIKDLDIENCVIDSLQSLHKFPKLETLTIDPATTIEDVALSKNKTISSFQLKECIISEIEKGENEQIETVSETVFDIQKLVSIAHGIKSLRFKNYKLFNEAFLKYFTQLETLVFEKGDMSVKDFLPVAKQIKTISLDECTLRKSKYLKYFNQLESLEIQDGYEDGKEKKVLKNFKKLLPLKDQLKKIQLWEDGVKEIRHIEAFTSLESIDIYDVSRKNTERIFSLPNLKRLSINIIAEKPCSFNLKDIPKITWLVVKSDNEVILKGLKHLGQLERLELENDSCSVSEIHRAKKLKHFKCNSSTDINKVTTIKTLQTLEFDVGDDYEINGLEQFPNLEYLSVPGTNKITLGKLDKLKIINMEGGAPESINFLKELPSLEKLDLGHKGLTEIPDLGLLPNLKMLNLAENEHIDNIEGLKHLKQLEYLNLYDNKISDIRILNSLPNLKLVNLAGNPMDKKEIDEQLDDPEIAVFMGISRVPFSIWESDEFYEY